MRYQLPFDAKVLAIYVAVVETRSMSDAAKKLAMTQSAISQAVKMLETELGVTLLDRSMRPMHVTVAGNAVYSSASRWLSEMTALRNQLCTASAKQMPLLRCGLVDSFASTGGPSLIKNIADRAKNLSVISGVSPIMWEGIRNRDLDLAITMPPPAPMPGISQLPLLQEAYVLALPKSFDKKYRELKTLVQSLAFIRYSGRTPSGTEAENYLKWLRLQPGPGLEFDTADAVLSMVASGLGWTMTTPLCLLQAKSHLASVKCEPLPGPPVYRQLVIMCRTGELGNLPEEVAIIAKRILREEAFQEVSQYASWLRIEDFHSEYG
ncbi:LysR family transcriptional regulator [Vreelandella profundi]|uniref:LysR family transcriptional regulator n=1 Tax=Vreelandella profundi TaxID=2852117 RepID=UPI001EF0A320|nr:LysR family transcriptional regulator [Halomonas profundi]